MDISQKEFEQIYTIGQFLGKGQFGIVSKAESKKDGLEYAVKKVELPQNPKYRKKLLREKQSLQSLNHENVIKSYHFTITNEKFHGKILFSD